MVSQNQRLETKKKQTFFDLQVFFKIIILNKKTKTIEKLVEIENYVKVGSLVCG